MKHIHHKWIIAFPYFVLVILVSCIPAATGTESAPLPEPSSRTPEFERPTQTLTPTASASPTLESGPSATHCPVPTPEIFFVEPVTSPTDQLTQVINVHIGLGEKVTVITESGTFIDTESPFQVEISLLPNTVHHLEVIGTVRTVVHENGCVYGGYSLRTTSDSQHAPLTIRQGNPVVGQAISVITPDNVMNLEVLASFAAEGHFASDFVFRPDSKALLSVGSVPDISVWNLDSGEEVRQPGIINAAKVAITSDGSLVAASGAADDKIFEAWTAPTDIQLWNTLNGEMFEFRFDQRYPDSIAINPSGSRLATGNREDTVNVWDIPTQQLLLTLRGDIPFRTQVFWHLYWKDDSTLVAGGSDAIYWWDTATGSLLQRLAKPVEAQFFVNVAFSSNADKVAAAGQDAYVYFWDESRETWSRWPASPDSRITQVCFSPDGQLLVAGTAEGQMLIWNVHTQQLLAEYFLLDRSIYGIRFSPDGRYLAIGGMGGPIWLWGIP